MSFRLNRLKNDTILCSYTVRNDMSLKLRPYFTYIISNVLTELFFKQLKKLIVAHQKRKNYFCQLRGISSKL